MDFPSFFPRNCILLSREAPVQDSLALICVQCPTNILGADLSPGGSSSQGMLGLSGPLSRCMVRSSCALQAYTHFAWHYLPEASTQRPTLGSQIACTRKHTIKRDLGGRGTAGCCSILTCEEFQGSRVGTTVFSEYYSHEEERRPIKLKYEKEGLP